MKMRVNEQCISCGLCVSVCPEIFQMDDDSMMAVASTSFNNYLTVLLAYFSDSTTPQASA